VVRPRTRSELLELHARARAEVAREYRGPLTLAGVARALSSSPRRLQRAYALAGETFAEDLRARRLGSAAEILAQQPGIPVASVARLTGYGTMGGFTRAFERRFARAPERFRRDSCNRNSG